MKLPTFTKNDADLERERVELREQRRRLGHVGVFREDLHEQVDRNAADARVKFEAAVVGSGHAFPAPGHPIGDALALLAWQSSPEYVAMQHAAIDAAPATMFASGTKVEHEAKLAAIEQRAAEIPLELERRKRKAVVDDAQARVLELDA